MARLTNLKPRLAVAKSRLGHARDVHGHSAAAEPWRAWYKTPEWAAIRVAVFERDGYRCQWKDCGVLTVRPHADHIQEHRGDRGLFFDRANVQTLCPPHHNRDKQREEHRARHTPGG